MAMTQCCYLSKGAKRPSHTTNMLSSSNISVNWSIWWTHLVDTFVTDAILSPKWLVTKCPWPMWSSSRTFPTTLAALTAWIARESLCLKNDPALISCFHTQNFLQRFSKKVDRQTFRIQNCIARSLEHNIHKGNSLFGNSHEQNCFGS